VSEGLFRPDIFQAGFWYSLCGFIFRRLDMEKHILIGLICGLIFGAVIFWGALYPALAAGGLVAFAAGLDGFMAAIGGGGLIGVTVAPTALSVG
jgi:hypothetical protein